MENETEVDEIQDPPEIGEGEEDTTDWKALALKNQGIAKRLKTKLEKAQAEPKVEKKSEAPAQPEKPNELDYGQKAFLKTYGIAGADELALAKSWMERTGDQLDSMVEDDMFTAKLTKLRDAKVAATSRDISGSKRGVQTSPKDSPEYWLDKPFDDVPEELRRKVLNAKLVKEKDNDKFSGNKIVIQ